MTIQTPREAAEEFANRLDEIGLIEGPNEQIVSEFEMLLAARDRALLAADDEAMEAMAEAWANGGPVYEDDKGRMGDAMAALRRLRGVEDAR